MRFSSKYREIEAERWYPNQLVKGVCRCSQQLARLPHVHTVHKNQLVLLSPGDWIIAESDGKHFYPCKPGIFRKNWQKVEGRE